MAAAAPAQVLLLGATNRAALARLLEGYGLTLVLVSAHEPIPGSYWGGSEAGLQGAQLFARTDTPLHSVLHEASHFICMSPARRRGLDRDAGGTDLEEAAVCYLQILLAGELVPLGAERLMRDMDAWGYSFRLGATRTWFERDGTDALQWLVRRGIVDGSGRPTGETRHEPDGSDPPMTFVSRTS